MSAMASEMTKGSRLFAEPFAQVHVKEKKSNLRVTSLCQRNAPVTGGVPLQRAINAEKVSIWWRHST